MADSKRLQIKKAITTQLETIGGATVLRGLTRLDDNETRRVEGGDIIISLVESAEISKTEYPETGGYTLESPWHLMLVGWVKPSSPSPDDAAEDLLQTVKQSLSEIMGDTDDPPLNGRVESIFVNTGCCRGPDQQYTVSYFFLPITVNFNEDVRNP